MLDIKINMFPTHAASKPVAMIPNCAATRHVHFVLDGHHKLEAAARLGVAITVLSFVSIDASLADEATVTGLPELLAR